ncbi:PA3496 family putative envelope integrity protein [Marinimicrobium alkaliphilum]|uniref:PA3496 family putative envelope integrity protein n=1 Tax=Marinimicrobium alkaliphilum TaxID=2202654 RepID=UPI000DB97E66|nr:hypothetical protein [Marinimicrobium alkaliphilum]
MSVTDDDLLDMDDAQEEETTRLTGREANQFVLEMRRKIEDRLERRRLRDQLGCDDLWELDC